MHVICLMAVTETGSPSCLFCRSSDSVDGFCGVEFVAVDFFSRVPKYSLCLAS